MKLWNTTTGQLLRTLEGHDSEVLSCAFSPTGLTIVGICESSSFLSLWTAATGRLEQIIDVSTDMQDIEVSSCCFSPDGKSVLAGCCDGSVKVLCAEGPKL
jgi:WD40 repeat protein